MSRKNHIISGSLPYHIYVRSNNRDWFYIPIEQMWEICIDQLFNVTIAYGLRVHAFTLMDNHFHLLASTPFSNIGENMNYFLRETSRATNEKANRINHVFGGRYKASLIQDHVYYFNAFRYIYQNPLRAKICEKVEDYPFTTLQILFGQNNNPLPLFPSVYDFGNPITNNYPATSLWLNRPIDGRSADAISSGLKKTIFAPPADRKTRKIFEFCPEDGQEIDAILNQK